MEDFTMPVMDIDIDIDMDTIPIPIDNKNNKNNNKNNKNKNKNNNNNSNNNNANNDSLNDIALIGEGRTIKKGLPAWNEPPLGTLNEFACKNNKYPYCIVTLYQIIRDLHIKQEVIDIKVMDGKKWGCQEYFIKCKGRSNDIERLLIPFHLDADIDLPWLQKVASECKDKGQDLYLCIHTSETIM